MLNICLEATVRVCLALVVKAKDRQLKELKGRVNRKTVINFYLCFSEVGEADGGCSDTDSTSQFKNPALEDGRLNWVEKSEIIF